MEIISAPGEEALRTVVMNVHIGLQNTICFRIGNNSNSNERFALLLFFFKAVFFSFNRQCGKLFSTGILE